MYFIFILHLFSKICQVVSTLCDDNRQVIKQQERIFYGFTKKYPLKVESLWKRRKRKRSYDTKVVVTVKNYSYT